MRVWVELKHRCAELPMCNGSVAIAHNDCKLVHLKLRSKFTRLKRVCDEDETEECKKNGPWERNLWDLTRE